MTHDRGTMTRSKAPSVATPVWKALASHAPGGHVEVTTTTGYGGAFASSTCRSRPGGACYRMVIAAPELGRYESIDLIDPGVYDHSALELDGVSRTESYVEPTRGKVTAVARSSLRCTGETPTHRRRIRVDPRDTAFD